MTYLDGEADAEYEVALSFAGEDRDFVRDVAERLVSAGVRVFYDDHEKAVLWGKDLYTHLRGVYEQKAQYTVVFISEPYARKLWTNHERQSAQARAFSENREYILPVRFDDTEIPGLPPTIGYIDLRKTSAEELVELILTKLHRPAVRHWRKTERSVDPERVHALIKKLQAPSNSLAEAVSEALELGRQADNAELVAFCSRELVGYPPEALQEPDSVPHRVVTMYCSPVQIHPSLWGGVPSRMFTLMKSKPERFAARITIFPEAVTLLEERARRITPTDYMSITYPLSHLNPEAQPADQPIFCYMEGNTYPTIVLAIRVELTKRLLSLLNA